MSAAQAAFAEPFAVCLHAVNRAGPLLGKRVLVTGAGPIGALTVIAARRAGALEIVATDVADAPLAAARKVGADHAINVTGKDALTRYGVDKGHFDVMFEPRGTLRRSRVASAWSGRPASWCRSASRAVK
jgi:L-idonate 5-dehydrogenase